MIACLTDTAEMIRKDSIIPAAQDNAVHGARLEIDLDAIAANYTRIAELARPAATAAVVKADAYGLGIAPVASRLAAAGCEIFFAAHFAEGVALRAVLPDVRIYIFHGLPEDMSERFIAHRLRPVLNSLSELAAWRSAAGPRGGAILNFDTGMSRLGLSAKETLQLAADRNLLGDVEVDYLMSHLACTDQPQHPLNQQQLTAFIKLRGMFPGVPASLANTAGVLLGPQYHFDLVRPGIGIYGGNPSGIGGSPFRTTIELYAKILQVREIDSQDCVGYGATYRATGPTRIAVAGIGYADGWMRALGNIGSGMIGGHSVPLVGRVSMDLCAFDVTTVSPELCAPGSEIELIGPHATLERAAETAATINYEMLTRLGHRFARTYRALGNKPK